MRCQQDQAVREVCPRLPVILSLVADISLPGLYLLPAGLDNRCAPFLHWPRRRYPRT